MVTLLALVVLQLNVTLSPGFTEVGVTLIWAVGAGNEGAASSSGVLLAVFLLQPVTETNAAIMKKAAMKRKERCKMFLLCQVNSTLINRGVQLKFNTSILI